jgi:predicted nucleic acid-binding protein
MKVLIDTSVFVSAMLPDHVHHAQSRPWIKRAKAGAFELVIAGHNRKTLAFARVE